MAKKKVSQNQSKWGVDTTKVMEHAPFIIFLAFLTLIYIANVHHSENKMREIRNLQSELIEVQYKYKSLKAEINESYRYTEVVKKSEKFGLSGGDKQVKIIELND